MDTVGRVKVGIAKLTAKNQELEASLARARADLSTLRRAHEATLDSLQSARSELRQVLEEQIRMKHRCTKLLQEREALSHDLQRTRAELDRRLADAHQDLSVAGDRLETLVGQLDQTERERDDALSELDQACAAFSDIRRRLKSSLAGMGPGADAR